MIGRRFRLRVAKLRRRVHFVLDGSAGDLLTRLVHSGLIFLVGISVVSVVLESDESYSLSYASLFHAIEAVAVFAFTVEYALRVWSAPEYALYSGLTPFAARMAFIRSGSAIIDVATILPIYLSYFTAADLRIFIFLRLLRFFKLARYSPGMRSLISVLQAERKALGASAIIVLGAVLFAATAMHLAERQAQPDKFGSIPLAMWWAMETVTTVGYGEVVPATMAGRIVASIAMVMGFVMLGLPVGIVATAFAEEIHRREFVITWGMVARVPLFSSLDAAAIAEIMRYLRAQSAPAGAFIVRKGETAHSMYFVAAGEVEVELPGARVTLGPGQFFGEMAVLRKTRRSANVRALQPTKLLVLDAFDLHTLIHRNPEIGQRIEKIARCRAELSPQQHTGDIIESEMLAREKPLQEEDA
jgi:voltage-gated potassium channel